MILAIDVGTSSARAALYDDAARLVDGRFHQVAYRPRVTPEGGAEIDAETLLDAVVTAVDRVLAAPARRDVIAVGVSTFWHGLMGFDASGRPATPVFLWGDTRSADDADALGAALDEERLRQRTGCHVHSSYWPAKLRWLARTRPEAFAAVRSWGSFGEHLEMELFGAARTSLSIASGTGLLDQARAEWDADALAAAGITTTHLFPLVDRTDACRSLTPRWSLRWPALRAAAWFPAVGDGAASNVGSGCVDPSRIALNLGTSAALRVLTPTPPVPPRGLWRYRVGRSLSAIGGATSEGGNVFAWCRDTLRLPPHDEVEAALAATDPVDHVRALPFLAGERSPGWNARRRGALAGLTLDTRPLDILRAMLDAVALRLALVYALLRPCVPADHLIVASGAAADHSPAWLQIITDALGHPITRSTEPEATSRGTALLALEAVGLLRDLASAEAPLGVTLVPDHARHARYVEALERQKDLDRRL
jgi:gluconokinase